MNPKVIDAVVQVKRATAQQWQALDPVLLEGEIGFDITSNKPKFGDGVSTWSQLPYSSGSSESVEVIDSLQSLDPTAALSAKQGYMLDQTKMSATQPFKTINGNSILGSGNIEIQGGGTSINVVDNLTSTSTADALSANQGKVLKALVDGKLTKAQADGYYLALSAFNASKFHTKKSFTLTQALDAIYDSLYPSTIDHVYVGWSLTPPASVSDFTALQTYSLSDLDAGKLNFTIPDSARCKCFTLVYPNDMTITQVKNTASTEVVTNLLTGEVDVVYQGKPAKMNCCDYQLAIQSNPFQVTFA